METYAIGEIAREFGVTARALRFYENKGLISPIRQGVTRLFTERDKVRLTLTLRGKRLGFTLEEIREIIDMYDPERPDDISQILFLCQKIRNHRRELLNKIKDINDTLNLMDEVERQALESLAAKYQPLRT